MLVILGLLTGGILSGQSLIRAAELRGVTSDIQRFKSSIYQFRDKYFALPGDMTNATKFWGSITSSGGVCTDIVNGVGTGTETCNGNGDGIVNFYGGSHNEVTHAVQHLATAGLIEGSYRGAGASTALVDGVFPRTRANSMIDIQTVGTYTDGYGNANATSLYGYTSPTLAFEVGKYTTFTAAPFLKPDEAWNIDTKLDDGIPYLGSVIATTGRTAVLPSVWTPGCLTPDTAGWPITGTPAYTFTSSTISCRLFIIMQ